MKDTSEHILLTDLDDNGILRLTLNDIDNKNALSESMMQRLIEAISKGSKDSSVLSLIHI